MAVRGGLLAGIGLGSLLTWLLDIYELAHPILRGSLIPGYPNMALTALVLIVFSSAFGVGLAMVASTLIRGEDVRQAGTAAATDPSAAAGSRKTTQPARTIFGFVRGS